VLLLTTLLIAPRAWAAFVPLANQSVCYSKSVAGPVVDEYNHEPGPAEWFWAGQARTDADNQPTNSASGEMDLHTDIYNDSCLVMDGDGYALAGGTGSYYTTGYYEGWLLFLVNQTQEYTSTLSINLKTLTGTSHYGELTDVHKVAYWHYDSGNNSLFGRIPPGSYWLHIKGNYGQTPASGQAAAIAADLCLATCTSLIGQQPTDQVVPDGGTANVQVMPALSPSLAARAQVITSYQWRKNLQNLANGGRISGVDTAHLTITSAVSADSGYYDCLVTQGLIVEPSREAHVTVGSTTAVEPPLSTSELRLAAPHPNPFVGSTRLDFQLARPGRVSLAVYDALGRRVKELMSSQALPAGKYAIDWNGTDMEGKHVAGGVYFIHLLSNGTRRLQRAVLMPGER
jgi:hypothetical protein